MPDRGHAAGHIDPVPCQTENVALPQPRRQGEQHHFTLVIGQGFKQGFGLFVRQMPHPNLAALAISLERRYLVDRSEEHTSELQSLMRISYAVFCLKKKKVTQ